MVRQSLCQLRAFPPPVLRPAAQVGYGRWAFARVRPAAAFFLRSHITAPSSVEHRPTSNPTTATQNTLQLDRNPKAWNRNRALLSTMHKAPAAKITGGDPNVTINTPRDPNTLSNYHNFLTKHTVAEFAIDFEEKVLSGGVELTLESLTEGETKEITLDTRYVHFLSSLQ